MDKIKIGVLAGSLRKESFCRKTAIFVSNLMPENFDMHIIDLGNLAMYNQDYDDENNPPKEWTIFRNEIKSMAGYLFVTPEYNRSIPAVLKNALDIASRPYGQNVWNGKPGAIISVSIGKLGAFGANHHLRQAVVFLNILLLQQPEAYIGEIASLMDSNGNIINPGTKKFLESYTAAFANWIEQIKK